MESSGRERQVLSFIADCETWQDSAFSLRDLTEHLRQSFGTYLLENGHDV
ncbi:MAG: hypothetical protein HY278_03065 [candidate division NC10 bacterium]|nr:hypothetical protein [candidate division NC10 bacterium]